MSDTRKYYQAEFTYTDNGQIFGSGARMTPGERDAVEYVLERYAAAGAIDQASVIEPTQTKQDFDDLVNEIMDALKHEVTDGDDKSQCQNCDRIWPDVILKPVHEIKDLHSRVSKGEPMSSGECPACGALCQPVKE